MNATSNSPTPTPNLDDHRGRGVGGVGLGAETRRCYLSADVPSGSARSVEKWLKTLLGRDDVQRIWMKPIGSKDTIWYHDGPLDALPDLRVLFDGGTAENVDIAA